MTGKRTDTSVAGVFTDLSDLLEEGTTSKMRKVSATPEKDFNRFVPTSLMVDTAPNEWKPVGETTLALSPADNEAARLLEGPSSQTIKFSGDANPAAAFAPTSPKPVPVNKTDPLGAQLSRPPSLSIAEPVASEVRLAPSLPPPPPVSQPLAPSPTTRRHSTGVLVMAVLVSMLVASVGTAFAARKLVRACRAGAWGERICALAP